MLFTDVSLCYILVYSDYSENNDELERLRLENKNLIDQITSLKHQLKKSEEDILVKEVKFQEDKKVLQDLLTKEQENLVLKDVIIKENVNLIDNQKERIVELEDALQVRKCVMIYCYILSFLFIIILLCLCIICHITVYYMSYYCILYVILLYIICHITVYYSLQRED